MKKGNKGKKSERGKPLLIAGNDMTWQEKNKSRKTDGRTRTQN